MDSTTFRVQRGKVESEAVKVLFSDGSEAFRFLDTFFGDGVTGTDGPVVLVLSEAWYKIAEEENTSSTLTTTFRLRVRAMVLGFENECRVRGNAVMGTVVTKRTPRQQATSLNVFRDK